MKRLSALAIIISALLASSAVALEISVAPATLVLSSNGGKLTVHTDIPFAQVGEGESVSLKVDGTSIEAFETFMDDCGNLVVQCTKEVAAAAIGDFEGRTTMVNVTLVVGEETDSEVIRVRK